MTDDPQNRRKHRRFTLSRAARMILAPLHEESPGQLIDISVNGASLTTRWAITAGVHVFISFVYEGESCEATGSVVRVFPFGRVYGLAVEFGFANEALAGFIQILEATPDATRPHLLDRVSEITVQIA